MNIKDLHEIIEKTLNEENIKYNKEELEKVVNYIKDLNGLKTIHGNDTLEHVCGVAVEVAKLRIDDVSIYASLLHESIRFSGYDSKKMRILFGGEIVDIVETVEKLSCFNIKNDEKIDSDTLRSMFLSIAKDIRTVIIKLADRLYNMRNIANIEKEEVKINMSKECLKIYAPIAHRLGMSKIKSELEDISFRVLMFNDYQIIKKQIDSKKKEREKYIQDRIEEVSSVLKAQGIQAQIYGRPKHFYSIYKKMKQKNCNADDLFDLLAIRVLVNSIKDCYNVLGIVHDMYKPMPGRFKDYIAVPKTNMYQSLHTTVFGEGGKPFEIQIRTWDMHNVAERGIAAHFSYKEKTKKISHADKKIIWLRKTLEIQQELSDNTLNLDKLKGEIFGEEVFVFTPKGDIKSLPKGSTTVDFAYAIHQKIAEKMVGSKVNGKIVPINTKLENTDIVEIITSSNSKGPNRDWLKFVKTSSARNKITSFLKKQGKDVNISKGKDLFEKELRKRRLPKDIMQKEDYINIMLKKSNFNTLEDIYENIGFGSLSPLKIVNRLEEAYNESNVQNKLEDKLVKKDKVSKHEDSSMVIVENIPNCKIKYAKCCNPIPGDDIVGYITLSNGVSIHRKDCINVSGLNLKLRIIKVKWKQKAQVDFKAKIRVKSNNRDNIISDILKKLKDLKLEVNELNSKVTQDREAIIEIVVNVSNTDTLQKVLKELKKIDSVFDTKRID